MKNFGLYKGSILFYTTGGSFASDAWIASDGKNCGDIAGESFTAFTADDGQYYNIGKRNVSPITKEKFKELFEQAHPAFKMIVELDKLESKSVGSHIKWLSDRENIATVIDKNPDIPIEEWKEFFEQKYFKS